MIVKKESRNKETCKERLNLKMTLLNFCNVLAGILLTTTIVSKRHFGEGCTDHALKSALLFARNGSLINQPFLKCDNTQRKWFLLWI